MESRWVINSNQTRTGCSYTWQQGDYWEFLAWALLDDTDSADALAVTAGYTPETFPSPGTEITIPFSPDLQEAAEKRMRAARLVQLATDLKEENRERCMEHLTEAHQLDPAWSVPVTDITVLLMEEGRTDEALELLAPLSHKTVPAMILAGIDWQNGNTQGALEHLAEALSVERPKPEALAAAGIVWTVTGNTSGAVTAFRRLLEDPDAPAELRVTALQYSLYLERELDSAGRTAN